MVESLLCMNVTIWCGKEIHLISASNVKKIKRIKKSAEKRKKIRVEKSHLWWCFCLDLDWMTDPTLVLQLLLGSFSNINTSKYLVTVSNHYSLSQPLFSNITDGEKILNSDQMFFSLFILLIVDVWHCNLTFCVIFTYNCVCYIGSLNFHLKLCTCTNKCTVAIET